MLALAVYAPAGAEEDLAAEGTLKPGASAQDEALVVREEVEPHGHSGDQADARPPE